MAQVRQFKAGEDELCLELARIDKAGGRVDERDIHPENISAGLDPLT